MDGNLFCNLLFFSKKLVILFKFVLQILLKLQILKLFFFIIIFSFSNFFLNHISIDYVLRRKSMSEKNFFELPLLLPTRSLFRGYVICNKDKLI